MSLIGIGVDLVDIERIQAILDRRSEAFLHRVFTSPEADYSLRQFRPAASLAARFAAKEAFIKALGIGWQPGMRWVDIEVERASSGVPSLRLHGATADAAKAKGVGAMHLSLSHGERQAIAYVALES